MREVIKMFDFTPMIPKQLTASLTVKFHQFFVGILRCIEPVADDIPSTQFKDPAPDTA